MISRLSNNLVDFDKLVLEPFFIFEKNNFLEENFYNDLRDHFPKEEYLQNAHYYGKKIFLNNKDNKFFLINHLINRRTNWWFTHFSQVINNS